MLHSYEDIYGFVPSTDAHSNFLSLDLDDIEAYIAEEFEHYFGDFNEEEDDNGEKFDDFYKFGYESFEAYVIWLLTTSKYVELDHDKNRTNFYQPVISDRIYDKFNDVWCLYVSYKDGRFNH